MLTSEEALSALLAGKKIRRVTWFPWVHYWYAKSIDPLQIYWSKKSIHGHVPVDKFMIKQQLMSNKSGWEIVDRLD